jgi:hypothetical protein
VSLVGTAMSRFALMIWAYQQTGSAPPWHCWVFFNLAPSCFAHPFRVLWWIVIKRKTVMLLLIRAPL